MLESVLTARKVKTALVIVEPERPETPVKRIPVFLIMLNAPKDIEVPVRDIVPVLYSLASSAEAPTWRFNVVVALPSASPQRPGS